MKTFISSLIVLLCIIIGVGIYSAYLDSVVTDLQESLGDLYDYIKSEDWENCKTEADKLSEKWSEYETVLAMFNDHEDVDKVKLSINALKENVKFKDKKHTSKSLSETKILLERLNKNETFTLENVLELSPKDKKIIVCYNRSL